jgi:aarF domain-containing kinase
MFDECLQDLVNLEFIPQGIADDKEARDVIVPGLANTLTILFEQSDLRKQREKFIKQREDLQSSGKLETLQKELQAIAKKYGSFRLPGYTTLIIRALATLEGIGLRADENFSLTQELFPYIARRLLTDDSLRIREALRAYLYQGRRRISVKRVDDIAVGFRSFTNLMKGSVEERAATGGAPQATEVVDLAAETPEEEEGPKVEVAAKDIAAVLFSTQGNFLQELLIDEGVAAIDALSRAALSSSSEASALCRSR